MTGEAINGPLKMQGDDARPPWKVPACEILGLGWGLCLGFSMDLSLSLQGLHLCLSLQALGCSLRALVTSHAPGPLQAATATNPQSCTLFD